MIKVHCYLTILIFLIGCNSSPSYKITHNTITIKGDSLQTEITIVDESIIHIKKYLVAQQVKELPNYVTILEPQTVEWKVNEEQGNLIVNTSKLKVQISDQGEISYHSKEGESLLAETNAGTFVDADTTAYYRVSQAFTSGEEAIYGLGQFQSGRMNMKYVPVRLEQFNQEIAVPVMISTKGYGLYWHNYSITDFNLPENEIMFADLEDEELIIRKTTFTPEQSGTYNFFVLSETPFGFKEKGNSNRRVGEVLLKVGGDTVIFYNTIWFPDSYSGEIELVAGKEYELVFKNTGEQTLAKLLYNAPDFNKTTFSSTQGELIDYYFIHGENPVEVLSEYTRLTGSSPLFPKKSYGFWQCREAYPTQAALLKSANEYRKRKIPIDNIVQDWDYWPKGTKGPEWDRSRYPDPQAMTEELDRLNLYLMVSVWPTVFNAPLLEKYDLTSYKLDPTGFIDFYDTSTHAKYYRMLSDSMFHFGVESIWLDGSEPTQHPNPEEETPVGKFKELSNAYSLLVTKAMYEGRRKEFPDERVFNLTRSGFAGQQRYGNSTWSGDVDGSWEQFAEQIPAGLNYTMTGLPYWTTDIGGFFRWIPGEKRDFKAQYTSLEYRELLTRWFQYGTFTPLFRIHGFRTETEIWKYGQEFEDIARKFIDVRYQLMPYIYSEARKVTTQGKALMSPLAYYHPDDQNTWDIDDQFFFGESIMVCPVTRYRAREREVYLPNGEWYDFWTGEKYTGGKSIVAYSPIDQMPLYVKAGSILPWGPKLQHVYEKTDEPLVLKIYPGEDASYTMYYDDGKSYDYEKGDYTEIGLFYSEDNQSLTIKTIIDGFIDLPLNPQHFVVERVGRDVREEVSFDGNDLQIQLK